MKSPFPGMDPYLETRWSNVHVLMMGSMTAALNRKLPPGLEARPEEEVRIESLSGERLRGFRGDIAVVDSGPRQAGELPQGSGSAAAVAEPIRIRQLRGPVVIRDVRIVDTNDNDRIVTVIELLSPWNKLPGRLNRDYVQKLTAFEEGGANWVEIDLLRSSRDHLPTTWDDLPINRRADYLVLCYVAGEQQLWGYPITLRQQLPTVKIPLRPSDQPVDLDLQRNLDQVYADGRFASLDYGKPPAPPLNADDSAWAADVISRAGASSS